LLKTSDIVVVIVAASGAAGAFIDLRTRRVPNPLTMGTAVVGVGCAALHAIGLSVGASLAGLAVGLLLMLPGHVIGATGAGDVKLFAAMGTLLGPYGIGFAFLYTAVAGGLLALIVAAKRGRVGVTVGQTASLVSSMGASAPAIEAQSNNRFAYAPAIAIGALVAALQL
jgi:Flp pilus assembly protein protease CpaA